MTLNGGFQLLVFFGLWLLAARPLGRAMAAVYRGDLPMRLRGLTRIEHAIYRAGGIDPQREMTWREYAGSALALSLVSGLAVFLLQRCQAWLPLNPQHMPAVSWDSSLNTAISFVTNTNWQGYGGETTMSYLTQMLGLSVQNFVSAAVGMAAMVALARGFSRQATDTIGNFWCDTVRGTLYILLPLSFLLAIALVGQGVVQTFSAYPEVALLEPTSAADGTRIESTTMAVGPAASQIAIKQLGTNGGGFFNANSAHPLENPTPLSNLLQCIAILLIPAGLCWTFGGLVEQPREGTALLRAMLVLFVPLVLAEFWCEAMPNVGLAGLDVSSIPSDTLSGGNMEGKETRFGIVGSSLWAVATTAASNGSVNSMHDSYSAIGTLIPMVLMQLGEVVFGGVGSGLYGMVVMAILAVFLAGLMVGRTPEYMGKKIGPFEIKMAALAVILPCACVLIGTGLAVSIEAGRSTVFNPGPRGFSEVLYAYSSASNNNGSALAGLGANTPFYNLSLGVAMLVGRFGVLIPVLALAGSLAAKRRVPPGPGTLPTDTWLFTGVLVAVVLLIGALTFLPALALGPIVESLQGIPAR